MIAHRLVRHERAITKLKITGGTEVAIWRDVCWIGDLPAMPVGTWLDGHLVLQLVNPSSMPDNVAWLREFVLTTPSGQVESMWATPYSNGQLGLNVTRDGHYFSNPESFKWTAPYDIPAGSKLAYRGRAATSTIKGQYLEILDKCVLTLDILIPE